MTDQTISRKEREQLRHQQEILQAAEVLFAQLGYHQTTMQMVAEKAQFSVGYLYKHFAGKEEMYTALLRYHIASMNEITSLEQARGLRPLAQLEATYRAVCNHFNEHREFMRIYHEEVAGKCRELVEEREAHFQDLRRSILAAQEAHEIQEVDADHLVAALQGATRELFARMAEKDAERPFDELPDLLFRFFIDPLRTPPPHSSRNDLD